MPTASKAPSLRFAFGTELFKYLVFNDPDVGLHRYDFSTARRTRRTAATFSTRRTRTSTRSRRRATSCCLWHGWADPALSPLGSDQLLRAGAGARSEGARLLADVHDAGRAALRRRARPDTVDWAAAIDDWVENGKAPERVIAQKAPRAAP